MGGMKRTVAGGSLVGRVDGSWGDWWWGQDGRGSECGCVIDYMKLDGMVMGGRVKMQGEARGKNAMRRRDGESGCMGWLGGGDDLHAWC